MMVDELLNVEGHHADDEYGHEDVLHEEYRGSDSTASTSASEDHASGAPQADAVTDAGNIINEMIPDLESESELSPVADPQGLVYRGKEKIPCTK